MNDDKNQGFFVIIQDAPNVPLVTLTKVMEVFKGLAYQDAVHTSKNAWGLLGGNFSQNEAKQLSELLDVATVPHRVLAAGELAPLPEAVTTKKISITDQGLEFFLPPDQTKNHAWKDLLAINTLGFNQDTIKIIKKEKGSSGAQKAIGIGIFLATGIPAGLRGKKKTIEQKKVSSEYIFLLDLFFQTPPHRVRIESENLDYSCLKEKMTYNTMNNFRTLITLFTGFAPHAQHNKGTRVITHSQPLNTMGYQSFQDFEKESLCIWNSNQKGEEGNCGEKTT